MAGRSWRFQARNFAFYGQPSPLAVITGLNEVDAAGLAAVAALPMAVHATVDGGRVGHWAEAWAAALTQSLVALAYNYKYALDWGYFPNRVHHLRRRLTPAWLSAGACYSGQV